MKEIIAAFFRLGSLGFGGPLATIAMMEEEFVHKKKWITAQEFSESFALIKMMPGPTATQLAIRMGGLRAGIWGGVLAGFFFIAPSFFLILLLGFLFDQVKALGLHSLFFHGMQVAALAVIVHGSYRLSLANLKKDYTLILFLLAFIGVWVFPQHEALIILFSGFMGVFLNSKFSFSKKEGAVGVLLIICLKAALLTFGTGLAIVPLLQKDVEPVIGSVEFLNAIALGQITPGPLLISVVWIGYKILHLKGAFLAAATVFLPGFFISLFLVPLIQKKWGTKIWMKSFYQFAVAAVIGAMFSVILKMLVTNLKDGIDVLFFLSAVILLFWKKWPAWLIIPLFGLISLMIGDPWKF